MDLLWGTVLLRPYVFAFLAVYLVGASLQFGVRATLLFIPVGYVLAFIAEYSSVHWGIPFGYYYYITDTADRELWFFGVPFMDSLSFVFLSVCSYSTALFSLCPFVKKEGGWGLGDSDGNRSWWAPWILGACLMTLLDIVTDPVTLCGDRWFLGLIYGYSEPGAYFGIPMENFIGWLVVGLVLIKVFQMIPARIKRPHADVRFKGVSLALVWSPILYISILLFNLTVTLAIGEMHLGIASGFLIGTFLIMLTASILFKIRFTLNGPGTTP